MTRSVKVRVTHRFTVQTQRLLLSWNPPPLSVSLSLCLSASVSLPLPLPSLPTCLSLARLLSVPLSHSFSPCLAVSGVSLSHSFLCLVLSLSPSFSAKPGSPLARSSVIWAALIIPHVWAESASWPSTFPCYYRPLPGETLRLRAVLPCPSPTAPECLQVRIFKAPHCPSHFPSPHVCEAAKPNPHPAQSVARKPQGQGLRGGCRDWPVLFPPPLGLHLRVHFLHFALPPSHRPPSSSPGAPGKLQHQVPASRLPLQEPSPSPHSSPVWPPLPRPLIGPSSPH